MSFCLKSNFSAIALFNNYFFSHVQLYEFKHISTRPVTTPLLYVYLTRTELRCCWCCEIYHISQILKPTMLLGNAPLLLSLIWAQLLSSEMAEAISFYPWGQSLGDRSEAILTKLRDDLSLTMERLWLPEPLASNPDSGLVFTNVDGEEYLCGLEEAAGKNPADTVPLHFYDSQLLSSKLAERCSTITTDYWSYEWCHQRAVTQFHIVNHKDGTDRHPQWSLGKFVSSEVVRERGESSNMSAAITQIVDTYDGGQWCDETQRPRRSEVRGV